MKLFTIINKSGRSVMGVSAVVAISLLWLVGCGQVAGPYGPGVDETAAVPPEASRVADKPEWSSSEGRSQRAAEERPGLATGFGERIRSEQHKVSFVRASSSPVSTDKVYYNDREGLKAMAPRARRGDRMRKAAGGRVEWGIRSGSSFLPTYNEFASGWRGSGRRLVVGKEGSRYSIVIKNLCRGRVEVVVSVDGLDVIDGKAASVSKRGYVIAPNETLEIKGWRTSSDAVAQFRFSDVAGSYGNLRHGTHRNAGVIGLAVFDEKGVDPWKWMPDEVTGRYSASPF